MYRTTKKCHEAKIAYKKLRAEFFSKAKELEATSKWKTFIDGLPRNQSRYLEYKSFSPGQRKMTGIYKRALRKIAKEVGVDLNEHYMPQFNPEDWFLNEEDLDEQIMDWWNEQNLHRFIVDNFLEDKENDNLRPIYLSKEDFQKLVDAGYISGFQEAIDR